MQERIVRPDSLPDPAVAPYLWAVEDSRLRTLQALKEMGGVDPAWRPAEVANSIGTVLYHIAAIEADYLVNEVLELPEFPPALAALFGHDVRDSDGRLIDDAGSLAEHEARLREVRRALINAYSAMDASEFRRVRRGGHYPPTAPDWVLHHLMQHEAEHRGEINLIAQLFAARRG